MGASLTESQPAQSAAENNVDPRWTSKRSFFYAMIVWLLGCLFFLMDYFVRISPSIMVGSLMSSFHVGAFVVGGLSAVFLYPYVLLQPFVGGLLDRHGPYRLLVFACLICFLGALIFSASYHMTLLYFARLLLGVGCSFSFVGTLKLISNWFPARYFSLLAGATQAFGMLGAFFVDSVLVSFYQKAGWRMTLLGSAGCFFILAMLILLIVRDYPRGCRPSSMKRRLDTSGRSGLLAAMFALFRRRIIWLNCIYNGALYAPAAAFAGLWGIPFLMSAEHASAVIAARQVSMIFLGIAAGSPILGALANAIKKRLLVMRLCAVLGLLFTLEIVYADYLIPWHYLPAGLVLFGYGFFAGGIIPSYALAVDHAPKEQSGLAIGIVNFASLGIGALLMPAIGWVLDYLWRGEVLAHHPIFSIHAYHYALVLLPISMLVACVCSFALKE